MINRNRRGAILIVVLGVLLVLSLLGVTFANITTLDRSVARNYLDGIRARLAARAGIEQALQRIQAAAERGLANDPAMTYWGANVSEQGSPDARAALESAANPSFALEDEAFQDPGDAGVRPLPLTLDGRPAGISGALAGGSHALHGDCFRLRVADANSRIHLNDGIEGGNAGSVSRNLLRILDILGATVGVRDAGSRILSARPAGGFRSTRELAAILGAAECSRIAPFVTANAWVDASVVNPVPLSPETLSSYPVAYNAGTGFCRYGRGRASDGTEIRQPLVFAPEHADPSGFDHAIVAMDEISAPWIERTSRAPVNVNAAPREVLVALITGLRGWFVAERRKTNPGKGLYTFMVYQKMDNAPGGKRGDEYGYLYSTPAFVGPGTTTDQGVSAEAVADEIIACRGRRASPGCPGLDYSSLWYGGEFRTWRQFHAFCDGLAAAGLLRDDRKIYFDHVPDTFEAGAETGAAVDRQQYAGPDGLVESPIQPRFAAQALADVLKANFNPNLAPNELNPDANLYLVVDKTDLICNSTEFCFTPMGIFEIESEGLVVETAEGRDLLAARAGAILARQTLACSVKVFDVYRETTQADFCAGTLGARPARGPATNNNRSLTIGPEPDNGPAPLECRWSGWLELSTTGGRGRDHAAGSVERTIEGMPEHRASLVAHFDLDQDLDRHSDSDVARVALRKGKIQGRNNPDRSEAEAGPYGPTTGAPGQYRLGRDWCVREGRLPGTGALSAPGDLRIDGAYVERDSSVMWAMPKDVLAGEGTVAMWMKPSFHPEMTGKPRSFFSMDTVGPNTINRKDDSLRDGPQQWINGIWFFASHDTVAFVPSVTEAFAPTYAKGPWKPCSIVAGFCAGFGGNGTTSPSLNHRGHADADRADLVADHRWTHLAYQWDLDPRKTVLWIDGEPQKQSFDIEIHPTYPQIADPYLANGNPMRLGEPSTTWELDPFWSKKGLFSRNWAADATIDEFHYWKGTRLSIAQDLYAEGRYVRPLPGGDASFTSGRILLAGRHRELAPATRATATSTDNRMRRILTTDRSTQAVPRSMIHVLGTAWTWHPEHVSDRGLCQMVDHRNGEALEVGVEMTLTAGGGVLLQDGGSATPGLEIEEGAPLRYRLKMSAPGATVDSILLGTPVIDDVTLYYSAGLEYLSFEQIGATL